MFLEAWCYSHCTACGLACLLLLSFYFIIITIGVIIIITILVFLLFYYYFYYYYYPLPYVWQPPRATVSAAMTSRHPRRRRLTGACPSEPLPAWGDPMQYANGVGRGIQNVAAAPKARGKLIGGWVSQ